MIAQLDANFLTACRTRTLARMASYLAFEGRPATTAGRFVNPAVFAHLRLAARRNPSVVVERPVFVLGMGRSGTTIVGLVLGTHPRVGFLNEPKALWHVIYPDEDIIGSYSSEPGRLYLGREDADEGARRRAQALYSWYLGITRSTRVVDKYPELIFRTGFVRALFPDADFVVVTRQPWATISSVGQWSCDNRSSSNGKDADWWGVNERKWTILWDQGVEGQPANADLADMSFGGQTDHHIRAAVEWIVTMRAATKLFSDADASVQILQYERLTEDPAAVIGAVLERLALPRAPATIAYAQRVLRPAREPGAVQLPTPLLAAVESTMEQLRSVG